ncbi:hypothetical protein BO86DRAFT_124245 [Aspergillus japonicus CBS 114.51]|uniref:Uncharacterized protein n=2 Tax=Aspergillus TaxID=5052 RepID=A0A2V5IFZ8_ASPV1|nr:hypothetical protein BO86DRAFT_124245 [Aspergillus japonicus CBS 114.51]PYI22867.1 hypothetical protein BO99DRAFT_240576 [Aspergillus violaceofuscus CBS 115571]RAH80580.1 hypothetical protein BO86DRAFT_124245 [Aspergillus japonicus CBS 114.51]
MDGWSLDQFLSGFENVTLRPDRFSDSSTADIRLVVTRNKTENRQETHRHTLAFLLPVLYCIRVLYLVRFLPKPRTNRKRDLRTSADELWFSYPSSFFFLALTQPRQPQTFLPNTSNRVIPTPFSGLYLWSPAARLHRDPDCLSVEPANPFGWRPRARRWSRPKCCPVLNCLGG